MGVQYSAVDFEQKKIIRSPGDWPDKYPGIISPKNPFSHLVVMMNWRGFNFQIVNEDVVCNHDWENITEEVYKDYLEMFPDTEK